MNNAAGILLALLTGLALGAIFFGGRWWTIRKGLVSARPGTWFLCSLLLRAAVTVTGFYIVARSDWRRLLACTAGFFVARTLVALFARGPVPNGNHAKGERAP